jgi:hypothetical protein
MTDLDFLLRARRHLHLVSNEGGKVSLKFDLGVLVDAPELGDAATQQTLKHLPGVHDIDLSLLHRRIDIHYDPDSLPPEWWADLVDGDETAARDVVAKLEGGA